MYDFELIIRCQHNDQQAFNELYRLYGAKTLKTAYLITGNRNIAEDAVQEAFFECFRDIGQLKRPETFPVWFHRLLVRICWRMAKKERKSTCSNFEDYHNQIYDAHDSHDFVETQMIHQQLREAIQNLKQPLRTTLILYYFNELSINEISQVLKCFQGTVKSRLHNARKILGKKLKAEFVVNESNTFPLEKEGTINVKNISIE